MEAQLTEGNINDTNFTILQHWFELIKLQLKIKIDAIIYLRTTPDTAYDRLKKRDRPEERTIKKVLHRKNQQIIRRLARKNAQFSRKFAISIEKHETVPSSQ